MCVCTRLRCSTDPLLHFELFLSSMFLSGERGNDTFVALNKRRGLSHAVSTVGSVEEGWGGWGLFNLHCFCWFDHKQLISMAQLGCSGGKEDEHSPLYAYVPHSGFPLRPHSVISTVLTSYTQIIVIGGACYGNFSLVPLDFPLQNSGVSLASFGFPDKYRSKMSILLI